MLADLRGGISIIDLQPYPHWLDAVEAMKGAIAKLGTYTNYAVNGQGVLAPIVVTGGVGIDFGWPMWIYRDRWNGHYHRWR